MNQPQNGAAGSAAAASPAPTAGTATGSATAQVGVTGLAVMGRNLARNIARHGYTVAVHNRSASRTQSLVAEHGDEGTFVATDDLPSFVAALTRPRVAIVMVKAGGPTDAVIDELATLLEPGDIVIDAGNAHFPDTERRTAALAERGIVFVGTGVSGGEEGALNGPSIMAGGTDEAWTIIGPILTAIAAEAQGESCCVHVGPGGSGHFVKMVHNGIEYADMQLIAEAYDLLRSALGLSASQIGDLMAEWNTGDLESYLIEITAEVLRHVDAVTGAAFVDVVLDEAEQKGTGRWTVQSALDLGVPVTGIAEATFARALSGSTAQRELARRTLPAGTEPWDVADAAAFVEDVRRALYASKVVAYSQGFDQIAAASAEKGWGINRKAVAKAWRGGCIIRAKFLDRIADAYEATPELAVLMSDPYFAGELADAAAAWRRVVAAAAMHGVPVPAFGASLSYYDGLRAERLPANLVQAQRDFFGAHTYHRTDRDGVFHTDWSGDREEHDA